VLFITDRVENFNYLLALDLRVLDFQEKCNMRKTSVICRLVMQGIISLLFASRHALKMQKWLQSARKQTLTLVLNVIVRRKRTSRLATKNALHVVYVYIERTKNVHSSARVNLRYKLAMCTKLATY